MTPEIQADTGQYCAVSIRSATARETVGLQCNRVRDAVRALLALYTRTRLLDFTTSDAQVTPQTSSDSEYREKCFRKYLYICSTSCAV